MAELDALFRPASLAVVGASGDPNKVGGRPIAFLRRAGWRGRLVPVNPHAAEVQGLRTHASLDEVQGPIDQAIVAVPAAQVPAAVQACIARGVRALQIFSAGFGEGPGAAAAQQALREQAAAAGVRVLGPNSLGLFNAVDGFFGTFATALDGAWPRAGGVGVATQSGAFGSYFFGLAQQRGLGFSHFVATGNEIDVDVADCIGFLVDDPATRVIVIALEGCRDGRKLAGALHAAQRAGKTVLAMKVGASAAGAQAARTHTGALAGADRVFDAMLREAGAFRARSLQALVDAAYLATSGPLPAGRRLLVVTTSGGVGVLAADAAEAAGLALPPLDEAARRDIRAIAPLADGANPVDTSAGILGDLSACAAIAARALQGGVFDAVLCFIAHVARNPAHWAQLRGPLVELRARHANQPFVVVGLADDAVRADLEQQGFAVFADPTAAIEALAACAPRAAGRAPLRGDGARPQPRRPGPLATEADVRRALAAQGLRFAPERHVPLSAGGVHAAADAAADAAGALGWPVVLKVVSPDIAHKTEAGGVALGLHDAAALRAALHAMHERVRAARPGAHIAGFVVARQLDGGVEVLLGTHTDPVFGPVVTVGAGGVLAELLDEVCVHLAPVDEAQARAMLRATRLAALLAGFRGAPACDEDDLVRQVVRLSELAWSQRDQIAGIDLNPVLARPDGAHALDALIVPCGEAR